MAIVFDIPSTKQHLPILINVTGKLTFVQANLRDPNFAIIHTAGVLLEAKKT